MPEAFTVHLDIRQLNTGAVHMLEGAIHYARAHTDWNLVTDDTPATASLIPAFDPAHGCAVRLSGDPPRQLLVQSDAAAVAKLAINHLHSRGFQKLAVYALADEFAAAFVAGGSTQFAVEVLREEPPRDAFVKGAAFVAPDVCAARLVKLASAAGLNVPDDVAVLGIGNDTIYCEPAIVPISAIDLDCRQMGFRAAQQLNLLLKKRSTAAVTLVPPRGITQRRSTDALAFRDDDLRAAVRFIRDNAHRPLVIADVLRSVPLHRRSLERRFRSVLGRSPIEELRFARVEIAKRLLTQTDQSISIIATQSGFALPQHLTTAFKQVTGITPSAYRDQFRRI